MKGIELRIGFAMTLIGNGAGAGRERSTVEAAIPILTVSNFKSEAVRIRIATATVDRS
jgi:hypothetical protein